VFLAIVLEETVIVFRGSLVQRFDVSAVGEEEVKLAVIVEVEYCHSTRHGFRSVPFRSFGTVQPEINRWKTKRIGLPSAAVLPVSWERKGR
jgi:hypothetical protein